jgi:predicted transcriptional regulator of viral defense system
MAARQSYTVRDSALIAESERRRRRVLTLREDEPWLLAHSSNPRLLLSRMADRGALKKLGGGRYVIAQPGRASLAQTTSWPVILDGIIRPYGDYYLGFLSAFVSHHLTDIESPTIYVAVHREKTIRRKLTLMNREIITTKVSKSDAWFGIESVRISRSEAYQRSDLERTLIDALWLPQYCGSPEIYALGWARALRRDEIDIEKLCGYALALGESVTRRAGFMLTAGGFNSEAREYLASSFTPRAATVTFDPSIKTSGRHERDREWGVSLNVKRETVEGWFAYGK